MVSIIQVTYSKIVYICRFCKGSAVGYSTGAKQQQNDTPALTRSVLSIPKLGNYDKLRIYIYDW